VHVKGSLECAETINQSALAPCRPLPNSVYCPAAVTKSVDRLDFP